MKGNSLIWVLGRTRKRIPALLVITLTQMCSALLGVFFALGTRGVIDGAISGDPGQFWRACGVQAALILGLLISGFSLYCITHRYWKPVFKRKPAD